MTCQLGNGDGFKTGISNILMQINEYTDSLDILKSFISKSWMDQWLIKHFETYLDF